jgi:hypothetical protein
MLPAHQKKITKRGICYLFSTKNIRNYFRRIKIQCAKIAIFLVNSTYYSTYSQGMGFDYSKDFDKFKDLFVHKHRKKKKLEH